MPQTTCSDLDSTPTMLPQAARIRIVMVATTHPGNIGAAARAMKNMGVSELVLVSPKSFPDPEATARASSAEDILAQTRVVSSVAEAVADCQWVVGASARLRSMQWPQVQPREMAEAVVDRANHNQTVAILFGRESSGLTNEELDYCQQLVHIPTNPDYSSLNVAAAIQLLCYEVRLAALQSLQVQTVTTSVDASAEASLATSAEMENFYAHSEDVAQAIGMLNPDNPRYLMRRFRRLFHRVAMDKNELNMLRGWLSATEKTLRKR